MKEENFSLSLSSGMSRVRVLESRSCYFQFQNCCLLESPKYIVRQFKVSRSTHIFIIIFPTVRSPRWYYPFLSSFLPLFSFLSLFFLYDTTYRELVSSLLIFKEPFEVTRSYHVKQILIL